MNLYGIIFFLLIGLFSCKEDSEEQLFQKETVYFNGRLYTVTDSNVWAEAMLIRNGLIEAIGTNEKIQGLASQGISQVDLKGRMVLPGIHDVHLHPLEAASDNFLFVLDQKETDPENYSFEIKKAVNSNSNLDFILGWGFDIYTLLDAKRKPIEILDDISRTKPIVIMEQTSHSVWVNSKALEIAGISSTTDNPAGGVIMKDNTGEPNGILIDNAGNEIIDLAISSIPNSEENDYLGLIEFALPELAKNGITSICDARTYWKRSHHRTWQRIEDEGNLTVRANLGLWLYPSEDDNKQIQTIKSMYSNRKNSFLKINQVKLYADGIIINTTAAMENDYLIDLLGLFPNKGLNYLNQSRIERYITELEPIGFDFHIHAIGNRGVNEALNAIENSATIDGRHRITHVEYVNPSDYSRFVNLNVTADAQVAGDFSQPDSWSENDQLVSPMLNDNLIPIKSLTNANARITLSSDWDVSELNPFIGIQNAVTRFPQEISLEKAIRAYTINAAYVMRQEDKVGTLEVGKEADFIVLDQNLFDIPMNQINQTKILMTYLQGEQIYKL